MIESVPIPIGNWKNCPGWEGLDARARATLSQRRYTHTLGVVGTAWDLSVRWGEDPCQGAISGLVHDLAREVSSEELLRTARQAGLIGHRAEERVPQLLHGPVAAWLLKDHPAVGGNIAQAVKIHTVGAARMSRLDRILFLADMIEPGRDFPGVDTLRELANTNLALATLRALESSLTHVLKNGWFLHPATVEARNALLEETVGAERTGTTSENNGREDVDT